MWYETYGNVMRERHTNILYMLLWANAVSVNYITPLYITNTITNVHVVWLGDSGDFTIKITDMNIPDIIVHLWYMTFG